MSSDSFSVFILGATGYIGGPLLKRLLVEYPKAKFVALVRSDAHLPVFRDAGVQVIQGALADVGKIRQASSEADLVINVADSDDLEVTKAVLAGQKDRFASTGRRPVLVHTSGTGVIMDDAQGNFNAQLAAAPFDDADVDAVKNVPPTALHRNVDAAIFDADTEGFVNALIISPPLIYGESKGFIPRVSRQIPLAIDMALKAGNAVYINEGSARWNNVHVDDVVDAFVLLIAKARAPEPAVRPSSYAKFYIPTSGQHTWKELIFEIGKALHKRGLVSRPDASSVTFEEANKLHPWAFVVATNEVSVGSQLKQLGWSPKHLDWQSHIDADVGVAVKIMGKV